MLRKRLRMLFVSQIKFLRELKAAVVYVFSLFIMLDLYNVDVEAK